MQERTVKYINIICSILITFFLLISVLIYYFPNLASKYFILSQITINGSEKSNINIIKKKIEERVDLFERGHKYEKVSINQSFPDYIVSNHEKYKLYIL